MSEQPRGGPGRWGRYLGEARRKLESGELDREEGYKDELARAVSEVRLAVLSESAGWPRLLTDAIRHPRNNLIDWRDQAKIVEWIDANPADVSSMLRDVWAEGPATPGERIRSFHEKMPGHVMGKGAQSTRLDFGSYLMMGQDAHQFPPVRLTKFRKVYEQLGYPGCSTDDLGEQYEHALQFLDDLQAEANRRGMDRPATRFDAQSVVWSIFDYSANTEDDEELAPMAGVLGSSQNTILYGPPGTGKTYTTTRRCVELCDGQAPEQSTDLRDRYKTLMDEGRIDFVTFHQSYGYEEFVEGLRPTESGTGGLKLEVVEGVLKRIAETSRGDPTNPHVLVIDEINRANISKVMGELITLLEEDKREGAENEVAVRLPYSPERFTLPANLHILGTMNTADRSIALLDTALRRRFEFEEMSPVPELLEEARERTGVDLPSVLRTINQRLEYLVDRDHLIGHAWLMNVRTREDLDSAMRNKIIPLLAEYFYDDWSKVRVVLGGTGHFVERQRLDAPPGLEGESGEERYRWTIRQAFADEAYERLVNPTTAAEDGE